LLGSAVFAGAAGVVVPILACVDLASFVDTVVLALFAGVLLGAAGCAIGAGAAVGAAFGATLDWAKAPIGRIARPVARSRLEMRVMVGFLVTGGLLPAETDIAPSL